VLGNNRKKKEGRETREKRREGGDILVRGGSLSGELSRLLSERPGKGKKTIIVIHKKNKKERWKTV